MPLCFNFEYYNDVARVCVSTGSVGEPCRWAVSGLLLLIRIGWSGRWRQDNEAYSLVSGAWLLSLTRVKGGAFGSELGVAN